MKNQLAIRYLGALHGRGEMTCDGRKIGRIDYEIDGYQMPQGHVSGSGEIRLPPALAPMVYGAHAVGLLTDGGRALVLRLTDKRQLQAGESIHVDVTGDLPAKSEWRT